MRAKTFIRLLSAFLFAVVVLVAAHFGVWWFYAEKVETHVRNTLAHIPGVEFRLGVAERSGYPFNVQLDFHTAGVKWQSADGEVGIDYAVDKMIVTAEMLSWDKVTVQLGKNQKLVVTMDDEKAIDFNVLMEGGLLTLVSYDDTQEAAFNFNAMSLMHEQRPVVRLTASYLTRVKETTTGANSWRTSVNNLVFDESYFGRQQSIERLLADFTLSRNLKDQHVSLLKALFSHDEIRREKIVAFLRDLQQSNMGLHLNGFQYNQDPFWVTLRGDVKLDSELRPQGNMSMSTNAIDFVMLYLKDYHDVDHAALLRNKFLYRLVTGDRETLNLNLGFDRGQLTMNGLPVGFVYALPAMMTFKDQETE